VTANINATKEKKSEVKNKERKCEEQAVPMQKLGKNKEHCERAKARINEWG